MNTNSAGSIAALAAEVAISRQKLHRAVVARIWELHDGGLDVHEVASVTGYPVHLVRVVLRGGNSTVPRGTVETPIGPGRRS